MPTSANERRQRKTEARKEEILRSAARAFARKGYHATSMEEIADALHMTKGSLYYYFKDKEEILFACHDYSLNLVLENLERVEELEISPQDKLRELITGHVEVMLEALQGSALAMEFTALKDDLLIQIVEKRDRFEAGLRRYIQQAIDDQVFAPVDVKLASFSVLGAINWIPKWYREGGLYNARTIGEFIADHFIAGLSSSTGVSPVPQSSSAGVPPVPQSSSTGVSPVPALSDNSHPLKIPNRSPETLLNPQSPTRSDSKKRVGPELEIKHRFMPHWQVGGSSYHVAWRTREKTLPQEARRVVLDAIKHQHPERMHVHFAVVMPDHVHLLIQPCESEEGGYHDLGEILHSIKSFSAKKINQLMDWEGPLWQPERYDRIIRNELEFAEKWDYLRDNAASDGLAPNLEQWDAWFMGSERSGRALPLGQELEGGQ